MDARVAGDVLMTPANRMGVGMEGKGVTAEKAGPTDLSSLAAFLLLAVVAVSWGLTWPINKELLAYAPPIWTVALRYVVASAAVALVAASLGRLRLPPRQDIPVIFSISILHMVIFGVLCSIGLLYVPAGRSVLLAYTTPLWVFPFARLMIGEPLTRRRLLALACGVCGLGILVNPLAIDWLDHNVLIGHGLILLAAIVWASSIVYARRHRWASDPFDLLFWQTSLACGSLFGLAFAIEGWPDIRIDGHFIMLLVFSGGIGTAVAFWALNTVNRALPATATAIGLLGVPVLGVLCSTLAFGEPVTAAVLLAMALIVGGIAIGVTGTAGK
jgi:drug/metabolite transporter (DMT)-like permease